MEKPDKLFTRVTHIGKDAKEIQADDYDLQMPVGEERRGARLGDMRYVVIRPENPPLRRVGAGMLEATEAGEIPEGRLSRVAYWAKRALIGVPLASAKAEHERLSKFKALPLLSSDAISSVAFATEAILINLAAAGPAHLGLTLPISLVIILLLCIVTISYRQTIPAYPNGGGSYARSITRHVTAVHVVVNEERALKIRQDWTKWQQYIGEDEETHLLLIESPYRSLLRPLLTYIDTMRKRHPEETLSVILPEFVVAHWWEYFLHNQTVLRLKAKLLFRPGIVVINLPQHIRGKQPALRPLPW